MIETTVRSGGLEGFGGVRLRGTDIEGAAEGTGMAEVEGTDGEGNGLDLCGGGLGGRRVHAIGAGMLDLAAINGDGEVIAGEAAEGDIVGGAGLADEADFGEEVGETLGEVGGPALAEAIARSVLGGERIELAEERSGFNLVGGEVEFG